MKPSLSLLCFPLLRAVACGALLICACKPTAEKIEQWKGTQKGPEKLRAAVRDVSLDMPLRIQAALALVDIDFAGPLVDDLLGLHEADRQEIAQGVAARVLPEMTRAGASAKAQLRAKDVLFGLREALPAGRRKEVDKAVVDWLLQDWAAHSTGDHSGLKIVRAVGASAGPALVRAIAATPSAAAVFAGLLGQIGTVEDRDAALNHIEGLLAKGGVGVPMQTLYEAIARLRTARSRALLLALAKTGFEDNRIQALQALALDPHASSVPALAKMVSSSATARGVRGAAFQALEAISGAGTLDAIAPILATDRDEVVRYRAAEAMITCCGKAGAAKLLESLSTRYSYAEADVADLLEKDIKGLGKPVLPVVRVALSSPKWIVRVIAVRILGDMGTRQDLTAIRRLAEDKTVLRGWPRGSTVGSEASRAAERLLRRLGDA